MDQFLHKQDYAYPVERIGSTKELLYWHLTLASRIVINVDYVLEYHATTCSLFSWTMMLLSQIYTFYLGSDASWWRLGHCAEVGD